MEDMQTDAVGDNGTKNETCDEPMDVEGDSSAKSALACAVKESDSTQTTQDSIDNETASTKSNKENNPVQEKVTPEYETECKDPKLETEVCLETDCAKDVIKTQDASTISSESADKKNPELDTCDNKIDDKIQEVNNKNNEKSDVCDSKIDDKTQDTNEESISENKEKSCEDTNIEEIPESINVNKDELCKEKKISETISENQKESHEDKSLVKIPESISENKGESHEDEKGENKVESCEDEKISEPISENKESHEEENLAKIPENINEKKEESSVDKNTEKTPEIINEKKESHDSGNKIDGIKITDETPISTKEKTEDSDVCIETNKNTELECVIIDSKTPDNNKPELDDDDDDDVQIILDDKDKSFNKRKRTDSDNNPTKILRNGVSESGLKSTDNAEDEFNTDDDDFDPSLLCPEVSMDVDESPVNTTSNVIPSDGNTSPLLYTPVFSTLVDEMTGAEVTLNLSEKELELRNQLYGPANPVQYVRSHCTACNVHLGSALEAQKNRFIHPMLKVLVCKECYNFYCSGEFEKDEDGSELYCRWCGQGGQVFCCSRCEFVFCKKCIRNNFGRKKLIEVNHSDEWECFRCDPSQLAPLRAHVAELFDYVRNEISRAACLNDSDFLKTDHSRCCNKKMKTTEGEQDASEAVPRKRRRVKSETDPDFVPQAEEPKVAKVSPLPMLLPKPTSPPKVSAATVASPTSSMTQVVVAGNRLQNPQGVNVPGITVYQKKKPLILMPPGASQAGIRLRAPSATIAFRPVTAQTVRNTTPGLKIGQTTVQRSPSVTVQRFTRPRVQAIVATTPSTVAAPPTPRPFGYRLQHEWFEKTVRASAKVNSNLSFTLTQLGKAQARASTVESLAVVHNKLQEILSTSINSLIQIRKNLRTEFIAGIKNIKFPLKEPQQEVAPPPPDDDCVIVADTNEPSTSVPPPLVPLALPSTLAPVATIKSITPSTSKPKDTLAKTDNGVKPKGFIKVKSFSDLQMKDCITIPDDSGSMKDPLDISSEILEKAKNIIKNNKLCKTYSKVWLKVSNDETPGKSDRNNDNDINNKNEAVKDKNNELQKKTKEKTKNQKSFSPANKIKKEPIDTPTPSLPRTKNNLSNTKNQKLFDHLPKIEIKSEPIDIEEQDLSSYSEVTEKVTFNKSEIECPNEAVKRMLDVKVCLVRSKKVEELCSKLKKQKKLNNL